VQTVRANSSARCTYSTFAIRSACTGIVGALALYLYEDIRYAERWNRADVPTELRAHAGTSHNFVAVGSRIAQAAEQDR
jgi:hypothetical protein